MQIGAITGHIDVAQVVLYAFWLFFAGLILYLLRENRREGYPLVFADGVGKGYPAPIPKAFPMPDGSHIFRPAPEHSEPLTNFVRAGKNQGAPIIPTGEPLTAGLGPGAWAARHDEPDVTFDDGQPKIVPLRAAPDFFLALEDPDVRGFDVIAADEVVAGKIVEAWIDRSEVVVRYLEVELTGGKHVLLPMNFIRINHKTKQIICRYIRSEQFALCPTTKHPDQVTLLEEDKICAFYAAGQLYAWPGRDEPLL